MLVEGAKRGGGGGEEVKKEKIKSIKDQRSKNQGGICFRMVPDDDDKNPGGIHRKIDGR